MKKKNAHTLGIPTVFTANERRFYKKQKLAHTNNMKCLQRKSQSVSNDARSHFERCVIRVRAAIVSKRY